MTQQTNEKLRFVKCINCRESVLPKCYSDASLKEFYIICKECLDKLFAKDENEAPEDYYDSQDQTL